MFVIRACGLYGPEDLLHQIHAKFVQCSTEVGTVLEVHIECDRAVTYKKMNLVSELPLLYL